MPAAVTPWTWSWGPAGGLAEAAHFGDNPVFDAIRLAMVLLGVLVIMMIGRVIVEQGRRNDLMDQGQTLRFVGLGLLVVSVSVTEAWVVGTTATPRLLINAAALIVSLVGVARKRDLQKLEPLSQKESPAL